MKKLLSSMLICLFLVTVAFAQEDKEVTKAAKEAFKNAEKAIKKNDFATAKVEVDNALKSEKMKTDAKTWLMRGQIFQGLATTGDTTDMSAIEGNLKEMLASYNKAKEIDNKIVPITIDQQLNVAWGTFYNRAVNAYNGNDYKSAMYNFEKADFILHKDSLALNNALIVGSGVKDRDNAKIKEISNRIIASPHFKDKSAAYQILADIANRIDGNPEEALAILKKGAAEYPNSKELMLSQVDLYSKLNKIPDAVASLEPALAKDPSNDYLHYVLGYFYQKLNNPEKAIEAFKKAIALKPEKYDYNYELGAAYYNQGGVIGKQINAMDLKVQKEKEKDGSFAAMTTQMKDLYKMSLPLFEKCVKLAEAKAEGTDANALANSLGALMSAAVSTENFNTALPYVENAVKAEPKNVEFLQHLTTLYSKLGKPEAAIPYYESAVKDDALNLELLDGLFNAFKNAKKYKEAVPYIEKAANTLGTEVSLWENLSTLYYFTGEKAKADAIEKKIEKLTKKN
jgi:tetratricopeptide (TPR) repeat protein